MIINKIVLGKRNSTLNQIAVKVNEKKKDRILKKKGGKEERFLIKGEYNLTN